MKRLLPLLLCLIILIACKPAGDSTYEHPFFSVQIPEPFEQIPGSAGVCFAPYGDPLRSSSIIVSSTELNWYFDRFTESEYEAYLKDLCGYEELKLVSSENCRVDGYSAKKIVCQVLFDQGTHELVIYAVHADRTYFFSLLNRENDPYTKAFDAMMKTVRFKEAS